MSLSVDAYQYDADKFSMDQLSIAKPVWMVKHELFTMLPCVQWHKEGEQRGRPPLDAAPESTKFY